MFSIRNNGAATAAPADSLFLDLSETQTAADAFISLDTLNDADCAFSFYNDEAAAMNDPENASKKIYNPGSKPYIKIDSGVQLTSNTGTLIARRDHIISWNVNYSEWLPADSPANASSATIASTGWVILDKKANAYRPSGEPVAAADLYGPGSKLVLDGEFAPGSRVALNQFAFCSSWAAVYTMDEPTKSFVFTAGKPAALPTMYHICYLSMGNRAIPPSVWTLKFFNAAGVAGPSVPGGIILRQFGLWNDTRTGSTLFVPNTAVVVDPMLSVNLPDSWQLTRGIVAITGGRQNAEDTLAFVNNNSTTFGNISGAYNSGTGELTLTSAGATATQAQWQAALRAVTYTNTSASPNAAARTVSFTVVGNSGGQPVNETSNTVTRTLALGYMVTYHANRATSGSVPTDATVYANGATVTVGANAGALARTGYTFAGWNTAADSSGTSYAASGADTFTMAGANITLYAKWTATLQKVNYTPGGGSGTAPTSVDVATGSTFTLPSGAGLTRPGYTFAGWSDGTSTYAGGATYTMGPNNVTLTAQWTATSGTQAAALTPVPTLTQWGLLLLGLLMVGAGARVPCSGARRRDRSPWQDH